MSSACSARTFLTDEGSATGPVPSALFVEEVGGVCGQERDVESAAVFASLDDARRFADELESAL